MKQNEWISVEDRLPPKDENVLCYMNDMICINSLVHGELQYLHYTDEAFHNHVKKNTTHWMKLPDAPNKETTNVDK